MEKKRLSYIDWAKAIGIVLICVGHFLPKGDGWKVLFYTFHVPLFVFISGLLTKVPTGFKDCMKKIGRLTLRIVIPYTVWHLLSSFLYLHRELRTWTDVWQTWLFLDGKTIWNDALWYAPCFFLVAVVFYLFCWAVRGNKFAALGLSLASLVGFVLLDKFEITVTAFGHENFLGTQNLIMLLGFLALGYACQDLIHKIVTWKDEPYKDPFLYAAAGAFVAFLYTAKKLNLDENGLPDRISLLYGDYNNIIAFTIMAVLLVVVFVPACALLPENRIARMLSRHSLFIMCSHYFLFQWWVKDAGIKNSLEMAPIRWSIAINVVLIYVLICFFAEALCKRVPACGKVLRYIGMGF